MKKVLSIACALVCTFCFTLNVCAQDWKTELIGIISSSNIDVKRSMQQLNEYQERYASVVNDSIEPYISFVKGIVLKADNPDESISHFSKFMQWSSKTPDCDYAESGMYLAECLLTKGDTAAAIDKMQEILVVSDGHTNGYCQALSYICNALGYIYSEKGEDLLASSFYRQGIAVDTLLSADNMDSYKNLNDYSEYCSSSHKSLEADGVDRIIKERSLAGFGESSRLYREAAFRVASIDAIDKNNPQRGLLDLAELIRLDKKQPEQEQLGASLLFKRLLFSYVQAGLVDELESLITANDLLNEYDSFNKDSIDYATGKYLYGGKYYHAAIPYLKRFFESSDKNSKRLDAGYVLALCYQGLKEYDTAISVLERLCAEGPKTFDIYNQYLYRTLSDCLLAQGKNKEALDVLSSLGKMVDKKNVKQLCSFTYLMADFYFDQNDFEKAGRYSKEIIDEYSGFLNAPGNHNLKYNVYMNLVTSYLRMEKYKDALTYLADMEKDGSLSLLDERHLITFLHNKGRLLMLDGDYKAAVDYLSRSLELQNKNPELGIAKTKIYLDECKSKLQ